MVLQIGGKMHLVVTNLLRVKEGNKGEPILRGWFSFYVKSYTGYFTNADDIFWLLKGPY